MDKYEYNLKLDQMKSLFAEEKYEEAAEIADTINWNKIKNVNALVKAGEIYEKTQRYEESRDVLLMAYDRSPIGRMIIYRLATVAIKMQDYQGAQDYYDEFVEIAPHDTLKYVLRYDIQKAKGASYSELIPILEELKEQEYTEEWAYELAYLYHKDGMSDKCIDACDELILWFGDGPYVERALELKMLYQPLTKVQEEKYRSYRQARELGSLTNELPQIQDSVHETIEIPKVDINPERYNTVNLQEEIARGMQQIMDATEKEAVTDTLDSINKIVEEIPYLQLPKEEEVRKNVPYIETDEEIDGSLKLNFQEMLGEDSDGQIRLMTEDRTQVEHQITGQITIEEVLDEWERTKRAAEAALEDAKKRKLESAKVRALQQAGDIMERLTDVMPKLDAGVTPKELLEEKYLQELAQAALETPAVPESYIPEEPAVSEPYIPIPEEPAEPESYIPEESAVPESYIMEESAEPEPYIPEEPAVPESYIPEESAVPESYIMEESAEPEPYIPEEAAEPEPYIPGEAAEPEEPYIPEEPAEPESYIPEEPDVTETYIPQEPDMEALAAAALAEQNLSAVVKDIPAAPEEPAMEENLYVPEKPEVSYEAEESKEYDIAGQPETELEESDLPEQTVPEPAEQYVPEETVTAGSGIPENPEAEKPAEQYESDEPLSEPEEQKTEPGREKLSFEESHAEEFAYVRNRPQDRSTWKEKTIRVPDIPELEDLSEDTEPEETAPVMDLTDEQKAVFSYFMPVKGMESQLCKALAGISERLKSKGFASYGNLIIQGSQGSGRTTLATSVIKVLQQETGFPDGKIGKIKAEVLNEKDLVKLLRKVTGGCLIIEQAGELSLQAELTLSLLMEQNDSGLLVILEDTSKGIKKLLAQDEGFAKKFTEQITVPIFTNDELVTFARSYSRELGYKIDDMAVLALYNRISNIQRLDQATTLTEVKEIVDEAIDREAHGGLKKAFSILTANRYTDDDRIVLREKDFE